MSGVNKVILVGNLGADPDVRHTSTGKAVAELRLATSQKVGGEDVTEWHRIILWEKSAEVAGQYLKKGSKIYVEGRIQTRTYDDKDGVKRYITEIVASTFQMLDRKADEPQAANEAAPPARKTRAKRVAEPSLDDLFGEE